MKYVWTRPVTDECSMIFDIAMSELGMTSQMIVSDIKKCDSEIMRMDSLITGCKTTIQYGVNETKPHSAYSINTEIDINSAPAPDYLICKINDYLSDFWKDIIESGASE